MFFPALLIFPVSHRTCVVLHGRSVCDGSCAALKAGAATMLLCYHFYAHGAGGTLYASDRSVKAGGVQIGHLLFRDIRNLLLRDLAYLVLVRRARTLGHGCSSLQQHRSRRRLRDESERAICIHGNNDRNDQPFLILAAGLGIELLAELHAVVLRLTKRWANRRSGSSFARGNLEFYLCLYFLWRCHVCSTSLAVPNLFVPYESPVVSNQFSVTPKPN